jgi:CheY-like chemotaxis protein
VCYDPTVMAQSVRPRVLLADDYPAILTSLERLLGDDCEIVGSVSAGLALLEAAARLQPDVVVVDLNLPEVNGIEAYREIRLRTPTTKVILLTADKSMKRPVENLGIPMVDKLQVADLLLTTIRSALCSGKNT